MDKYPRRRADVTLVEDMLEPDPVNLHWLVNESLSACGLERVDLFDNWTDDWTSFPSQVTCLECKATKAWREAALQEVISK